MIVISILYLYYYDQNSYHFNAILVIMISKAII